MNAITRRVLLAVFSLLLWPLAACEEEGGPKEVTVEQLGTMLESDTPPVVFDANGEGVRNEYGIIPGARLLSDAEDYDVSAVLPAEKDKPLVFYCSNGWCTAAKTAAKRAQAAGHSDVSVLPVGIKGWKNAGKPTEQPRAES